MDHTLICDYIASGSTDEARFESLALGVFAWQYERIEAVRRLADRAGRPPAAVHTWRDIPAVPTAAFKRLDLFTGGEVARVFTSSGTAGTKSRAVFSAEGLALMDEAIRVNARAMLFPDGRATRILVLAPPPEAAPGMIMAYGMDRLIREFGLEGSRFLLGPGGLDALAVVGMLEEAAAEGVPVTLIGASFGFVHLLDGLVAAGRRIACAPGSRTMDAGGFKGRSREVSRHELGAAIEAQLSIPAWRAPNLLGMTELASQVYDGVLRLPARPRRKVNPPWTRTRVLDPETLEDAAPGMPGLLWHLDLANVERPMVVQTDDLGVMDEYGFEVLGRAAGAEARGCSLSIEELLQ